MDRLITNIIYCRCNFADSEPFRISVNLEDKFMLFIKQFIQHFKIHLTLVSYL